MELLMRKTGFYILMAMLFLSCTALAEKSGRLLEGSAFAEKTLTRFRYLPPGGTAVSAKAGIPARSGKNDEFILSRLQSRDKTESFSLSLAAWPGLRFRFAAAAIQTEPAAVQTEAAETVLYPVSYSFLCSSYSGWNEFTVDLSGTGRLTRRDRTYTLSLTGLEALDISRGRIRRGDARISGNDALTVLRNRRERIAALIEWMSLAGPPDFADRKAFEAYWKPRLFPELVSKKKRPPEYEETEAQWIRDGDLRWNAAYTAAAFPEELRPLRDSGTMLRDWEEAPAWIYLTYEWDALVQRLEKELQFIEN
jgi:hypothetical protein